MENWQCMFVNFAVVGFIFQFFFVAVVYFISKSLPYEKTDKELLESIYNQPSISGHYLRNLKF